MSTHVIGLTIAMPADASHAARSVDRAVTHPAEHGSDGLGHRAETLV